MNLREKLKNVKVAGKLNMYRTTVIVVMLVMGIVSAGLSALMQAQVRQITEVWQVSLSCVQELNGLTSDYRLKQYGHLVAADKATKEAYEAEMESIDQEIAQVSAAFQRLISTDTERTQFDNANAKWETYKEQSEQILTLSRAGKTADAGEHMVGDVYDTFKDFNNSFSQLETYENNELVKAKNLVTILFYVMLVIIVVVVLLAIYVATAMGKAIISLIMDPLSQIEEAIAGMREGDLAKGEIITYESEDELGAVAKNLKESMSILYDYVQEISENLRYMAKGDLTKHGDDITNFLGDFASIKESLLYILKRFNSTLTEIQNASDDVASGSDEIAKASQALSEGATDQASAIEELTATVSTVYSLADDSSKASQNAYEQVRASADKAEVEKQKMTELMKEMEYITEISKEIENIITAIEDIASQTNLLSLNASIEAARAGEAGRGFAVVADQIGKLAADSAKSAVNTRELISKTLVEIDKGNAIAVSTSEAFEQMISDMKAYADIAQQTMENVNAQASALEQVDMGIEQISGAVQNTAASSEENSAISTTLSDKAEKLDELVKRFKLF